MNTFRFHVPIVGVQTLDRSTFEYSPIEPLTTTATVDVYARDVDAARACLADAIGSILDAEIEGRVIKHRE
jgi:hypothetical protein